MSVMTDKRDEAKGPAPLDSDAAQAEPAGAQAVPSGNNTGKAARVEIISFYHGICHMRVCAVNDASDEEVLTTCNTGNPSGTQHGWAQVLRGGEPGEGGPIACADNPTTRTHLLVGC